MKNSLSDLSGHLFAQLENLADFNFSSELTKKELEEKKERLEIAVKTATTAKGIADSILEVSRIQLDAARLACEYNLDRTELPDCMDIKVKRIEKVS